MDMMATHTHSYHLRDPQPQPCKVLSKLSQTPQLQHLSSQQLHVCSAEGPCFNATPVHPVHKSTTSCSRCCCCCLHCCHCCYCCCCWNRLRARSPSLLCHGVPAERTCGLGAHPAWPPAHGCSSEKNTNDAKHTALSLPCTKKHSLCMPATATSQANIHEVHVASPATHAPNVSACNGLPPPTPHPPPTPS